jgi:hypothetical protein
MHFPSIYFGFLFESPLDCPIRSSKVRPTPVGTSPGVVGALPVIPFGALNRNPSNPAAWRGKWRKKHFWETKNLDSIRETAETQNYKSDVATVLFTFYHFDVAGSGSVNVDRPIKICHVSACHVSTNSRPVRNFFQILHIGGPSDQSSVNVDRPIKIWHVSLYSRPINGTNQSAIDTRHAKLQHDV